MLTSYNGMKLSDYVANFIKSIGVDRVFGVTGGGAIHLVHSFYESDMYVASQHEQGAAYAADGYARANGIGCAVATSGPGFTNLISGIAASYMDSIPVIYLTGNVPLRSMRNDSNLRQLGAQEVDTSLIEPLVKYHTVISDPSTIAYELDKAYMIAKSGRPGPVHIDIPEDVQRSILPSVLDRYNVAEEDDSELDIDNVLNALSKSKRPVLVIGWGVHCSGCETEILDFIDKLGIPVLPTWGAKYMIPTSHHLYGGTWGPYGSISGNNTIQNSDLVISIGSRLDTRQIGGSQERFAPNATKIVVDIDKYELTKFHFGTETILYNTDARTFMNSFTTIPPIDRREWIDEVISWRVYDKSPPDYDGYVNPYRFFSKLSNYITNMDVCVDTGATLAWAMNSLRVNGNRIYHAFNTTPMGYALPASIGIHYVTGDRVVSISGDGGFQMNIQELATVANGLPITMFVTSNGGYGMIKQTEEDWHNSKECGSSICSGVPYVDIGKVAEAYGISSYYINDNSEIDSILDAVYSVDEGPIVCIVNIHPDQRIIPKVKSGQPLDINGGI